MKSNRNLLLLWIAVCLPLHVLFGQAANYRLQRDPMIQAGLSIESWKAGDDRMSSFTIPMTFMFPATEKLLIYGMTTPAFNRLNTGEAYALDGMSDVKVGGHYLALNDKVLFTFGLNLPTGKNTLSTEEYAVANIMVMPALQFRMPSLGQGFDAQFGLSTAGEVGPMILGGGVSYFIKNGFEPFSDYEGEYNPGEELTLTLGLGLGRTNIDLLYTIYSKDIWEGEEVFRSGNRFIAQLLTHFQFKSMEMTLFVRESFKGKNMTGSGSVLETEAKNSNVNMFDIQLLGLYPESDNIWYKGALDLKIYSNNEYDVGGATLFGFGGGILLKLSESVVFDLDMRYYTGVLKLTAENVTTAGLKMFGGLQFIL